MTSKIKPPLLCLVGPTASGKTEVALEIAKILPVEMISCDSMQVYQEMPILSQAPSKSVQKKLRAHLVSILPPSEEYSAAHFRRQALQLIPEILHRKRIPLIVGGTGLYLRSLLDGLFDEEKPSDKNEAVRQKWYGLHEKEGAGALHEALYRVDPSAAQKIHPNDARRLVRALEVYEVTGRPISEMKNEREGIRSAYDLKIVCLDRGREDLYARIERRVDCMLGEGLLEEVRSLSRRALSQTAGVALGLREMSSSLRGECTLAQAVDLLKKNTRHYAKRQMTWFRREKDLQMLSVGEKDSAQKLAGLILRLHG